jgi:hypothetical protein
MGMKEKKLTARAVEHAAPGMHGDGNGLWFRVVTPERRRVLMDDWAAYLAKPPAQVVRPRFGKQHEAYEVVA